MFNIAQTEGIAFEVAAMQVQTSAEKIAVCEDVISKMPDPPVIHYQVQAPAYYPGRDEVEMPALHTFISSEEYYGTLFHELAHSTGHARRLNRKEIIEPNQYGSEPYSREELTAEMSAAYLCALTGIGQETLENSAAYIQGWLKALKNDKTLLIKAAGQAQKAVDYIMDYQALIDHL